MIPWYAAAAQFCELSTSDYSISASARAALKLIGWPAGGTFTNKIIRHSPPTRFGERYRADIGSAEQVRCVLGANAVGLSVQNTKVTGVDVRTFSGVGFRVESRTFILAMGGIENARFLLHTQDGRGKLELGNEGGNLGRCFADHFRLRPGMLVAPAGLNYHEQGLPGGAVTPMVSASEAALRGRRFQNFGIALVPDLPAELISRGYLLNEALGTVRPGSEFWHYQCDMICEPSANPDSRITLGEERDALGLRRVRLDWRLADKDFESLTTIIRELARTVGSEGIGRFRANERGNDPRVWYESSGGLHHMGTTRMGETAADGVVDSSCRVHGTDNLYASGSSVFPGFGFANPTLTIVALALRLADHVKAGP
jgi:choline dehydrogenase-like flavoprotein